MQCQKCGFIMPQTNNIQRCVRCDGELAYSTEEWLSDPSLGLVQEIRPGQIELAKTIDETIREPGPAAIFAEGGCGIGKSMGYLIPALLTNKRTGARIVVVTAKKSLQDQLENKDVPYLQRKLGVPKTFVSLKGKSNYICKKQLRKNKQLFDKRGQTELWQKLTDWTDEEKNLGDLNTFPGETPYPTITVTAKECTGGCKYSRQHRCGYRAIKKAAKEADLIIANHSLLGFDLRFGTGRLFAPYSILIVDEAHACPDYLRRAFSREVSETWMKTFLQKAGREQIDTPNVKEREALKQWEQLFKSIPDERLLPPGFFNTQVLESVQHTLIKLLRDFKHYAVNRWLPGQPTSHTKAMNTIIKHCEEAILNRAELQGLTMDDDIPELDVLSTFCKLYDTINEVDTLLSATTRDDENFINSREVTNTGKTKVVRQPVNLATFVKGPLQLIDKLIFTSATLNNNLLKAELGVDPKVEITQPSPFDYRANSIVYLPQHLPRPGEEEYSFAVAGEITQLITASKGNALVLFSARSDLENVLRDMEYYDPPYRIFTQTENHRPKEVMKAFEKTNNSVIFGLRSFFEGIDVQGMKLRLVVLVKIPFPHTKDPLCQAKKQRLGNRWWNEYYYPMMLTDVQQAAGRLIRTQTDKGVLAILDVRMWVGGNKNIDPTQVGTHRCPWRGYGYRVFKALPFENYTPNRNLVIRFLRKLVKKGSVE